MDPEMKRALKEQLITSMLLVTPIYLLLALMWLMGPPPIPGLEVAKLQAQIEAQQVTITKK